MKTKILSFLFLLTFGSMAFAEVTPKSDAPNFTLTDIMGKEHKLSEGLGKWVVLEWFNKGCPFVKKHYGSQNMQGLQKNYTGKGVVWYTIVSSAKGEQGYEEPKDAIKTKEEFKANPTAVLRDTDGVVGRLYGAKTTPHMFVISPEGKVVYAGAIDDNNSPDPGVIAKSKNYVAAALDAGMSGKAVVVQASKPYGCAVKYAN